MSLAIDPYSARQRLYNNKSSRPVKRLIQTKDDNDDSRIHH